jgi:hypothetical protein
MHGFKSLAKLIEFLMSCLSYVKQQTMEAFQTWKNATMDAIQRETGGDRTVQFTREDLITNQLQTIIQNTGSSGATPEYTLSKTLQELRDANYLIFVNNQGVYQLC